MGADKPEYRAYSDIIDLRVCAACAAEAWELGLSIEWLSDKAQENIVGKVAWLRSASRRIVSRRKRLHSMCDS
jgi:hypothetical protein